MRTFIVALPLTFALLGAAAPAQAQHAGHSMPAPASEPNATPAPAADPHAGHSMPMRGAPPAAPADPHAGHHVPAKPAAPVDAHASHRMGSTATPASNATPHTGHSMPTRGSSPAAPAAPHSGHGMPAQPAAPADPHAGHRMGGNAAPASAADPHVGHTMPMRGAPPPTDPHAGHTMGGAASGGSQMPDAPPPPAAFSGPKHAADTLFDPSTMSDAREQLRAEQGDMKAYRVMADRLETRIRDGRDGYLWDAQGWYGGDIDKLWIKSEGAGSFGEEPEEAEVQALWSRAITPWFDIQAGVRYDFEPDAGLSHLVLGLQGLAPYFFEIDAATFLSHEGDLTARVEVEYDQLITQKLILQPRAEVELAAQDVRETGIGAGLSSIEAGLRLRYEFVPEFAPYIGIEYQRKIGKTARLARDEGEDVDDMALVLGVRVWF